ncbi:MAG: hypothetical protein HKP61_18185 [Dactylosporangium sp.]|nr:hypothetical protein [Dactylosporangium sp.]NNJ62827.1 hypothetical protein [Dactylosporangium sp.]
MLAAEPGVRTRFGGLAGTIAAAGLTDPQEWLVHTRPPAGLEPTGPKVTEITGFGEPKPYDLFSVSVGEYQPPRSAPLLMAGFRLAPVPVLAIWWAAR